MLVYGLTLIVPLVWFVLSRFIKENEKALKDFISFFLVVFIIFIYSLRYEVGFDWLNYTNIFRGIGNYRVEPVYESLFEFIDYRGFIFLSTLFPIGSLFFMSLKYGNDSPLFMLIFVLSGSLFLLISPLRQSFSLGFVFTAYALLDRVKVLPVLLVIIGIIFHTSNVIFLAVFYLCNLKINKNGALIFLSFIFVSNQYIFDTVVFLVENIGILSPYAGYFDPSSEYSGSTVSSGAGVMAEIFTILWFVVISKNDNNDKYYNLLINLTYLYVFMVIISVFMDIFARFKIGLLPFVVIFMVNTISGKLMNAKYAVPFIITSLFFFARYIKFIVETSHFYPFSIMPM